ncbi:hypothetical protein GCM10009743_65200 [Kribbella swartbergensis]
MQCWGKQGGPFRSAYDGFTEGITFICLLGVGCPCRGGAEVAVGACQLVAESADFFGLARRMCVLRGCGQ